jgi:hypothetical protein
VDASPVNETINLELFKRPVCSHRGYRIFELEWIAQVGFVNRPSVTISHIGVQLGVLVQVSAPLKNLSVSR